MVHVPVLLTVFNRPDATKKVFEAIRAVRPKQLFVAADGPRAHKEGEWELCKTARNIVTSVDWDCDVQFLFHEKNLGCGKAVSTAVSWFFEHVEQGIILEDDCLPNTTFFSYCETLLERYKDNERIMHISGTNFIPYNRNRYSYYFGQYFTVWGWATWKRAWDKFRFQVDYLTDSFEPRILDNLTHKKKQRRFWLTIFNSLQQRKLDAWSYQWMFSCWVNNGLAINPTVNLVTNVGFGADATHTRLVSKVAYVRSHEIDVQLKHPPKVIVHKKNDTRFFNVYHKPPNTLNEIRNITYRLLPEGMMKILRKARRTFFPNLE